MTIYYQYNIYDGTKAFDGLELIYCTSNLYTSEVECERAALKYLRDNQLNDYQYEVVSLIIVA